MTFLSLTPVCPSAGSILLGSSSCVVHLFDVKDRTLVHIATRNAFQHQASPSKALARSAALQSNKYLTMMNSPALTRTLLLAILIRSCSSFLSRPAQQQHPRTNSLSFTGRSHSRLLNSSPFRSLELLAKKKKATMPKGQGFGKTTSSSADNTDDDDEDDDDDSDDVVVTTTTTTTSESSPFALQSVATSPKPSVDTISADVRTQQILREKYGLKPLAEQNLDPNSPIIQRPSASTAPEEEFDIMTKLPEPVLLAIDRFLKLGLTVSAILFIAAGLCVTWEAWSVTSNTPLPEDIDRFITNVVEPNFTKGLLVLLGFSISLGLFASAQLGSQASQYRED